MQPVTALEIPPDVAEIAKRLEVRISKELGSGDDGTAWLLTNGRVLRKTFSRREVAVAFALRSLQDIGEGHPAFPRIDGVWWTPSTVEINGTIHDTHNYFLIREEMEDVDLPRDDSASAAFAAAVGLLNIGWKSNRPDIVARAVAAEGRLQSVAEGLVWAKEELDVKVLDVGRVSNLGRVGFRIGIRDFSRAEVPDKLMRRISSHHFDRVPEVRPRTAEEQANDERWITPAVTLAHRVLREHVPGAAFDGEPFMCTSPFERDGKKFIACDCFYHTVLLFNEHALVFTAEEGGMVKWVDGMPHSSQLEKIVKVTDVPFAQLWADTHSHLARHVAENPTFDNAAIAVDRMATREG